MGPYFRRSSLRAASCRGGGSGGRSRPSAAAARRVASYSQARVRPSLEPGGGRAAEGGGGTRW